MKTKLIPRHLLFKFQYLVHFDCHLNLIKIPILKLDLVMEIIYFSYLMSIVKEQPTIISTSLPSVCFNVFYLQLPCRPGPTGYNTWR